MARQKLTPGNNWGYPHYEYLKINNNVDQDDALDLKLATHIDGGDYKHSSGDILFNSTRPTIPSDNVLAAIEEVDERIDGIVNNPDPNKDLELVDFRTSSVFGVFSTAKERGDNIDNEFKKTQADAAILVTVGVAGDYSSIGEALGELSLKTLKYNKNGLSVEILLLSGFVMTEQIIVDGLDLSWIKISSEDAIVDADVGSLVSEMIIIDYGAGSQITSRPLFGANNHGVCPVINTLFDMNGTAASNQHGFSAINSGEIIVLPNKGCLNSAGSGIHAIQNGRIMAAGANISGSKGNGISCFRGSYVNIRGGTITDSGGMGLYADNNCFIDAANTDFSRSSSYGIQADHNSYVCLNNATVNDSGIHGVGCQYGSIVDIPNSTINNSGQRGLSCSSGRIVATNSNILNSGSVGAECNESGIIDVTDSIITGSANHSVFANYGGIITCRGANLRKVEGVDGQDIRVLGGGIVIAYDAVGGYYGARPNTISNNGMIMALTTVEEIPATLQNGWTGTLNYGIDEKSGLLWIRGVINDGNVGDNTIIAQLNSGYRPSYTSVISVFNGTKVTANISISTSGAITIRGDELTVGDGLAFNALVKI